MKIKNKKWLSLFVKSKMLYFFVWIILLFWITESFGYDHIYFIGYFIAATLITVLLFLFVKFILFLYRKFEKSRLAKSTLTIVLILLGVFIMNGALINKFKSGFYFEKYKTSEEAKAALLKLHPIGSSVDELVKTLEKAGMKINNEFYFYYLNDKKVRVDVGKNTLYSDYSHRTIKSIFSKTWSLWIKYTDDRKIESMKIQIYQGE